MKETNMKNFAGAILLALMLVGFGDAQNPITVTDYFLALPNDRYSSPADRKIKNRAELIKYRKSLITIEDITNGYLKLDNNGMEGWSEFALFRKSDGTYLFAISEISCGPGCSGELQLLTYKNGKWTDVTNQFSPKLPTTATSGDYEMYWKLPRVGRTLIFVNTNEDVKEEREKLVYKEFKFEWNGTKFVGK
jgi:hypothetical protein